VIEHDLIGTLAAMFDSSMRRFVHAPLLRVSVGGGRKAREAIIGPRLCATYQ
jgi:hypothetical protein